MYDGLSKDDLRIILAHQEFVTVLHGTGTRDWMMSQALYRADEFLYKYEETMKKADK